MIIMASAGYCKYCKKAKQELEEEIQNGTVKVIDSNDKSELKKYFKKDLRGFPAFYNTENEKESIGYSLKKDLFRNLNYYETKELEKEIKEGFTMTTSNDNNNNDDNNDNNDNNDKDLSLINKNSSIKDWWVGVR